MSAVRLPAKIEHLESLIKAVSDFASKHGFGEKRNREVELATEEAVVNIMHYAYPEGRPGEVEVQCRMVNDARLIVEIRDWGAPFDIRSVSGPDVEAPLS
ncbi:MAG: ATP-binding protein, partial [Desulfobacterales bacterium]|nr:ATP-binding protein [Desulfobacterales bacterium]